MQASKKILVIIQRSNGDVFLSNTLIQSLYQHYKNSEIDLLVNDDTLPIAKTIANIRQIHTFSYRQKKENRWRQERKLITNLFKKYDISINLTASDRSVLYALLFAKHSISAIEPDNGKSWWKRRLLSQFYFFNLSDHILINNLKPLQLLGIRHNKTVIPIKYSNLSGKIVKEKLALRNIRHFLIFHPSAQYEYKVYPVDLRNQLLALLNNLNTPIVITGGKSKIDNKIKKNLPLLNNIYDFIGETTIEEYMALSDLSSGYIGVDTLNMHISAAQDKSVFSIFGPTNLRMWSPWCNQLRKATSRDTPIQTYGNITIFQANMPCVACGNAGCDDKHGHSECLDKINPKIVFEQIRKWHETL